VEWILKLAVAGDEGPCMDIREISKPDDLGDIANLGLALTVESTTGLVTLVARWVVGVAFSHSLNPDNRAAQLHNEMFAKYVAGMQQRTQHPHRCRYAPRRGGV
jgi:hypothetical protein